MKVLIFSIILLLCFSCRDNLKELQRLSVKEVNPTQTIQINFCTMNAQVIKTKLKFIFVLDKSGSNQRLPNPVLGGPELPGTDQTGNRRYNPIVDFINSIQATFTEEEPDDNTNYYSLVNFSSAAGQIQGFTNDENTFLDRIIQEKYRNADGTQCIRPVRDVITTQYPTTNLLPDGCPSDSGFTNYANTLDSIQNIINQDSIREKNNNPNEIVSSHYIVFFISDGAPMIGYTNSLPRLQELGDIRNKVEDITRLSRATTDGSENNSAWIDSIQIHTGYYFGDTIDPTAQEYLRYMAEESGDGQAHQFAGTTPIDFSSFRIPERNMEHLLDDIIVINKSSIWNGEFLIPDSDGDGLSDQLENQLGSNPLRTDSDNNKISDAVEYKVVSTPCSNWNCYDGNPATYACGGANKYNDLDGDGLNDCEEVLLGSRSQLFDSNNDDLYDDLALRYNLGIGPTDPQDAHDNKDADPYDNYHEIKYDTPTNFNNSRLWNLLAMNYNLVPQGKNEGRNCYTLNIYNFKEVNTLNNQTIIKVYIKEKTLLNDRLYLRTSEKTITNGVNIIFNNKDFN